MPKYQAGCTAGTKTHWEFIFRYDILQASAHLSRAGTEHHPDLNSDIPRTGFGPCVDGCHRTRRGPEVSNPSPNPSPNPAPTLAPTLSLSQTAPILATMAGPARATYPFLSGKLQCRHQPNPNVPQWSYNAPTRFDLFLMITLTLNSTMQGRRKPSVLSQRRSEVVFS